MGWWVSEQNVGWRVIPLRLLTTRGPAVLTSRISSCRLDPFWRRGRVKEKLLLAPKPDWDIGKTLILSQGQERCCAPHIVSWPENGQQIFNRQDRLSAHYPAQIGFNFDFTDILLVHILRRLGRFCLWRGHSGHKNSLQSSRMTAAFKRGAIRVKM